VDRHNLESFPSPVVREVPVSRNTTLVHGVPSRHPHELFVMRVPKSHFAIAGVDDVEDFSAPTTWKLWLVDTGALHQKPQMTQFDHLFVVCVPEGNLSITAVYYGELLSTPSLRKLRATLINMGKARCSPCGACATVGNFENTRGLSVYPTVPFVLYRIEPGVAFARKSLACGFPDVPLRATFGPHPGAILPTTDGCVPIGCRRAL